MQAKTAGRLGLALGLILLPTVAGAAEPDESGEAQLADRARAAEQAVGAAVVRLEQGIRFNVDGLDAGDVTGWQWAGKDISEPLQAALARGAATLSRTPAGFKLEWNNPPETLGLDGGGPLGVKAKKLGRGILLSSPPQPCPEVTEFGPATEPRLAADTKCLYDKDNCQAGLPAGTDYPGTGKAVAVAAGTVVKIGRLAEDDQGKGNYLIVRHLLPGPDCPAVYSSYQHLDAFASGITMNLPVGKGQALGNIGGSGFGKLNQYPWHLHLEMKSESSGAAASPGQSTLRYESNQVCATDPDDPKAQICWQRSDSAYLPSTLNNFREGLIDPGRYLNRKFSAPSYRQISRGENHTCAIKADDTLACWGQNDHGQTNSPFGNFTQVSVGSAHSCALKMEDRSLVCWGWNAYGQATPPLGNFKQVSAGGRHSCAVKADGGLKCWGNNWWGQNKAPEGQFKQASAGSYHSCAIREDDTLACWGNDKNGQVNAPEGRFTQVSAGNAHTCAIKGDGSLACWGDNDAGQADPPEGSFRQLETRADYNCGTRLDGFLACWGKRPTQK